MSSEKFNPNGSSSKKAESLPEIVTSKLKGLESGVIPEFAEPTEGVPERASGNLALKANSYWQKILFAIGGEPAFSHPLGWLKNDTSLLGRFLTEQWKIEADKRTDQLVDHENQLVDHEILQSREMCRAYMSNWVERQMELARCEFFEKQREALKELGHTGWLTKNMLDFPNKRRKIWGPQDQIIVEGEIEGKEVRFIKRRVDHYDQGTYTEVEWEGIVDSVELGSSEARELYDTYSSLAFDIDNFYHERKDAIEKALSFPDDETIDDNTKEMYRQFRESLERKTSIERKKDIAQLTVATAAEAKKRAEIEKVTQAQRAKEEQGKAKEEAAKKRKDIVSSVYPKQK